MSRLLVLGAGGHGKVVADAALESGWKEVAFLDDGAHAMGSTLGLTVLGPFHLLADCAEEFTAVAVAIGQVSRRLELLERCVKYGFQLPVVRHPSAIVSRFARLGTGSVVFANAVINADAELGSGCIVNTGATVDHDCNLGQGVHVCPGAHLAGSVRIGDRSWVGIGAVVRQGISIGSDVMIGAGAVVISDIPDGEKAIGVPARVQIKRGRSD